MKSFTRFMTQSLKSFPFFFITERTSRLEKVFRKLFYYSSDLLESASMKGIVVLSCRWIGDGELLGLHNRAGRVGGNAVHERAVIVIHDATLRVIGL